MPVAKLKASRSPDVMKAEAGNDSLDTIIRQAIGKEPFLSFSRTGDSPVQWIQLLHALDQQELPGWPVLTPLKVQLQKCDKCSQEFCSQINYRRHLRGQHRLKKLDKDSTNNRDLLGAYWDKLSLEEAKEVLSFNNVMLEEVPGSAILKALATLIRKQGFSSFPQYYLKAGSALLDIVQARYSFPISSQELFGVLDDASEKTFLCGNAVSMKKYILDGEAGKISLEPKNVVACTSLLLEQILVKAWLADKDVEALRWQKLLVEEEEAAQKRQAEILEKKRQKKLRQKEHRVREKKHEDEAEVKENISNTVESVSPAEASLDSSDFEEHHENTFTDHVPLQLVPFQSPDTKEVLTGRNSQSGYDLGRDQNIERQIALGNNYRHAVVAQRQALLKSQLTVANGHHTNQNSQILKFGVIKRHGTCRDQSAAPIVTGNKVWSRKPKPVTDGITLKARPHNEPDKVKNHQLLIGSISVALNNCNQSKTYLVTPQENCMVDNLNKENSSQEKSAVQNGNNRLAIKLWRPVCRHGSKDTNSVQNGGEEAYSITRKGDDPNLLDESCLRLCDIDNSISSFEKNSSLQEDCAGPGSFQQLSSNAAKAFLAQRWKEAVSLNHVTLVLSPDSDPPNCHKMQDPKQAVCPSSNVNSQGILASAENQLSASSERARSKLRVKPEKGIKIKYIPKQKAATY